MALAGAGGGGFGQRTTPLPLRAAHHGPASTSGPPRFDRIAEARKALASHWSRIVIPVERWFARADLAPDLAEDIGSARWFRGFATMLGLGAAAVLMWPSFAPLQAAPMTAIDDAARDEFRVGGIRPLALGADSGRHMNSTAAVIPLAAAPERQTIDLSATLGAGDSFPRMLQRAGLASTDIVRVLDLVGGQVKPGSIPEGTRFAIRLGARTSPAQPRPLEQLSFRPRFDLALDIRRSGGALALAANAIAVDTRPMRIRGIVGASLYRSARAAGAPASAVQDYLRTIDEHMAFEEIAPGDEFDLVFANRRAGSGEQQAGDLLY
ncbi:MAG: M23 family peptidase, partial [Novosphingobium sp.]